MMMIEVSKEEFVEFLDNYKGNIEEGIYGKAYVYSDYSFTSENLNEWPDCMIACRILEDGLIPEKFYIRKE